MGYLFGYLDIRKAKIPPDKNTKPICSLWKLKINEEPIATTPPRIYIRIRI
jgi:hypothetical protein